MDGELTFSQPDVRLGPYRLLHELGEGAFSRVYLAEHPADDGHVVLKTARTWSAELEVAFRQEYLLGSRLRHPHLGEVIDHGYTGVNRPFVVMTYHHGETLAERPMPQPPAEVARLGAMLARALAHVHAQGLVHRDVAPGNVLVEASGNLRLIDFGMLAFTGAEPGHGTPLYMAPEALAGERVAGSADAYALGALLYRLATGRAPFEDRAAEALLEAALHEPPPPVAEAAPQLPPALSAMIMRLLAKEPADRPTAAEAARVLARLEEAPQALAPGAWMPTDAWRRWEEAALAPGAWAFVGEAGLGASRHLLEAFAHLRRADVPAVRVSGSDQDGPYALAERLWRYATAHAPDYAATMPSHQQAAVARLWPWACADAPKADGAQLVTGLRQALAGALAAAGVQAVLVDDWEAVDAASRTLIAGGLAKEFASQHWLLASRQAVAGTQALALSPLAPESASEWLGSCLEVPVSAKLAARLHAECGGNPGWMAQALGHLAATGGLEGEIALPDSVGALLDAQWARLSLDQRALAEALAVYGPPFALGELAALGPVLPDTWPLELPNLVGRGVLALSGGTYRFAHGWWSKWLVGRLAAPRRSQLALSLARALAPASPEEADGALTHRVARLYAAGGDLAATVRWGLAAGRRSAEVFANAEALEHYGAVLSAIEGSPEGWRYKAQSTEARVGAADVRRLTGDLAAAVADYEACLEAAQMPTERARIWVSLGKARQMLNQLERAREAYSEAIAILPAAEAPERLRALSALSRVSHHLGDAEASEAASREALALAREAGDTAHEAEALSFLGTLMAGTAAYAAGLAHLEEALALREAEDNDLGRNDTHMLLGNALYTLGRYREAARHFEANRQLSRQVNYPQEEAFAALNLALCESESGNWTAACAMLEACRALAQQLGDEFLLGVGCFVESLARLHLGDMPAMEAALAEGRERETALGNSYLRLYGLLYEAERHLFLGAFEPARRAAELALGLTEKGVGPECQAKARLLAAEAWLHQGGHTQAQALLSALTPHAEGGPAVAKSRLCGWLAFARGAYGEAREHWRRALEAAREAELAGAEIQLLLALDGLKRKAVAERVETDLDRAYALAEAQRDPEALALCCLAQALDHMAAGRDLLAERLSRRGQELLAVYTRQMPSVGARATFLSHPARAELAEIQGLEEAHRHARQARRLEMLLELGRTMGATREPDRVLALVRDFTLEVTQAERCLVLLNPGRGELKLFGEEGPYSRTIVGRVVKSRESECVLDTQSDEALKTQSSILDLQVRSVMCVPMTVDATLHGVLYVDSRVALGTFTPDDLRVVVAIARQAAVALDNARLHAALLGQLRQRDDYIRRLEESEGVIRHLEELDKLRAEYFQAASHDLRSPLAAVNASCQALLKGIMGPLAPDQADTIAGVHHASRSLTGLIDGILDAAELQAGKLLLNPRPVAIAGPINESVKLLAALAESKGLTVRHEPEALAALPPVRGDERRLARVVLNLLSNAIKYTRHGHVAVGASAEGGRLVIRVSDTGPGLPPERQANPFERYGARAAEGGGLGLWLVKGLVDLHEGTLHVDSRPGEGTTFVIGLPLA